MSGNPNAAKSGDSVLGVILGILSIAAALILTILGGVIGGVIAVALGVIAILVGVKSRRAGKGIPAILTGVIAIVLALIMTLVTVSVIRDAHDDAKETGVAPLVEKHTQNCYMGILGIILSLPGDEDALNRLSEEYSMLNGTNTSGTAAATAGPEAPAAEEAPSNP